MPFTAYQRTIQANKQIERDPTCSNIYAYWKRPRNETSMRCYIELECEHGEIIKTVLIGETNGQKLKTRVQNICQYPFLRTVLAEDVDDKIEHMI